MFAGRSMRPVVMNKYYCNIFTSHVYTSKFDHMSTLFGVTIVPTFPSQTCSGQIVHHLSVPNTSSHQNKRAKKRNRFVL